MVHAGHLWRRTVESIAPEFPEVEVTYQHTDAAMIYMVAKPADYDVIVTDNLFGDLVTDLAAVVTGGIGLAASGNINVEGTAPSLFEPIHGSAPDIAGQGTADPTASILSGALMAEHLGLTRVAQAIQTAVEADLASRGDAPRTTSEVGDAIASRLA
jgi:3-isopropylmalate dehydrogenase